MSLFPPLDIILRQIGAADYDCIRVANGTEGWRQYILNDDPLVPLLDSSAPIVVPAAYDDTPLYPMGIRLNDDEVITLWLGVSRRTETAVYWLEEPKTS